MPAARVFDRKGQSLSLQLDQDCVLPRVVVTYERVDPLAAHGPALAEANSSDPAWVVSLADFLMITDLLSSPSMFWHYTAARWRQSQKGSLIVNSEADMLGLFLSSKDTFGTLIQQLDTKPQIAVGPSAQFINNYYTAGMATAPEPKKPTVAIPQPVIEALDNLLWAGNDRWAHMVNAVIAEPGRTWTRLRAVQRKFRTLREPRRIKLTTSSPDLALWVERMPDGSHVIEVAQPGPTPR